MSTEVQTAIGLAEPRSTATRDQPAPAGGEGGPPQNRHFVDAVIERPRLPFGD
jgi:hypothetical protein